MAVFVAGKGVLAVVQVNRLQALKADDPVKFFEHLIEAIHDVIPAVMHMAGIQADAQPVARPARVHDRAQLLEAAAYGHYFAHRLHARAYLAADAVELREVPAGNLAYKVVKLGGGIC